MIFADRMIAPPSGAPGEKRIVLRSWSCDVLRPTEQPEKPTCDQRKGVPYHIENSCAFEPETITTTKDCLVGEVPFGDLPSIQIIEGGVQSDI
jgi:hypothetical protein